jgi:hypothetical protein
MAIFAFVLGGWSQSKRSDSAASILPTQYKHPAFELLQEQVSNRITGRHCMDADEILLIATIGALLPYLAVAAKRLDHAQKKLVELVHAHQCGS